MDSYYSPDELISLGIKIVGDCDSVKISRKCSIYTKDITIRGDHVRIDDFCFLSGHLEIGSYVHIAAFSLLNGRLGGIIICDYVNISSRVSIYSNSDDYSGEFMTGPLVPDECKAVVTGVVNIGRHSIIGADSVILPGVIIGEGNAYGAFSLINKNADPWGINVGIPARRIKDRSRNLLKYESIIR